MTVHIREATMHTQHMYKKCRGDNELDLGKSTKNSEQQPPQQV